MDAPPPKRRRTSPRLAGRGSSDGPEAAPPGRPDDNDNNTAHAPADAPRSKIPLFASPTRASLARHNPDILERRRSVSRGPSVPPQPPPPPAPVVSNSNSVEQNAATTVVRPLQQPAVRSPERNRRSPSRALSQSPTRSPARSPTRRLGSLFSEPAVQSPTRGQSQGDRGTDGGGDGGGTLRTALPQRTPVKKPVPRPLPPPEPTRAEDVLEPLVEAARERQRRAAAASGGGLDLFRGQQEELAEPELPPTPEHPDPALTTSPPGIHNVASSTPTKWPARQKGARLGGTAVPGGGKANAPSSSSPLKQPPLKPTDTGAAGIVAKPAFSKATVQKTRPGKDKAAASTAVATSEKTPIDDNRRVTRSAAVRGIKPADPDAAKKKERDALLAEIAELEADLALAGAENERIRKSVEEAAGAAQPPSPPPPDVREHLLGLLRRRAPAKGSMSKETAAEEAIASWLQGAANPIALLPFGKPAGADGLSALLDEASAANEDDTTAAAAIASHRPVPMTADEELPYLQAFTPLVFSSQIVLLPADAPAPSSTGLPPPPPPLLQQHRITVASAPPHRSLFRARIEMTVNAKSLRVTDLRVPRIEPLAAAAELQPLLARCGVSGADSSSSSSSSSSALLRNVTVLAWAMGEWVRVAVRRARFWVALERRLQAKPGGGGGAAGEIALAAVTGRRPRPRKRKRRQARAARRPGHDGKGAGKDKDNDNDDNDEDDDSDDSGDDDDADDDDFVVSEAELLAHAGRTAMDVDVPFEEHLPSSSSSSGGGGGRGLRVQWTIQFDWTGEARSQIGLLVGVPGKWRKADDRGRLAALPRLFDQLVHGHTDPAAAVETVVALLAERR